MIAATPLDRLGAGLALTCSFALGGANAAAGEDPDGPWIDLGRGPVLIHEPAGYDPAVPAPLVLLLHAYSTSGAFQESYMQFAPLVDQYGFFYLYPQGTTNSQGHEFWNATHACCDFEGSGVDDSGYLLAIINEMKSLYSIDDRRVCLIGHSNGGFMAYRMACDHAETIAAIASLAGVTYNDPAECTPAAPVHVLHIHGTADAGLHYGGGHLEGMPYPGAVETVEMWATYNGCALTAETLPPINLDVTIPGDETIVTRYDDGCEPGGSAELWTIVGGPHSPALSADFRTLVIEFLLSHPKPADCPADVNGDSTVNVLDILAVLAVWGATGGAEDINADGVVNVLDLLEVLAAWGPC